MNKGSQNKLGTFEFIQRKQIPFFLLRNIIKTKPRSLKRQHSHTQSSLSLSLCFFLASSSGPLISFRLSTNRICSLTSVALSAFSLIAAAQSAQLQQEQWLTALWTRRLCPTIPPFPHCWRCCWCCCHIAAWVFVVICALNGKLLIRFLACRVTLSSSPRSRRCRCRPLLQPVQTCSLLVTPPTPHLSLSHCFSFSLCLLLLGLRSVLAWALCQSWLTWLPLAPPCCSLSLPSSLFLSLSLTCWLAIVSKHLSASPTQRTQRTLSANRFTTTTNATRAQFLH